MRVFAVIPAAGIGKRFGGAIPKQYQMLAGKTVIEHSIRKLQCCPQVNSIWIALREDDSHWQNVDVDLRTQVKIVEGGAERADSVRNAINSIAEAQADDWVLVHDAVRPLVETSLVTEFIDSLSAEEAGAILAMPVHETVKRANTENLVESTVDRTGLWTAQTPQVFRFGLLQDALSKTAGDPRITDEASAMEACGYSVRLVRGQRHNIKITAREDLGFAEQLIQIQSNLSV